MMKEQPEVTISVFKDEWKEAGATITYDSFLTNQNSSSCSSPCNQGTPSYNCKYTFERNIRHQLMESRRCVTSGSVDLASGVFTCLTPGLYTVAISGWART